MAKRPDIPFKQIADAALSYAETLLFQWIGGKRSGKEWQADRTKDGGIGDSLTVNLRTGAWMHGAGGKDGGDLISLYAYVFGLQQNIAAIAVADLIGLAIPEACRPPENAAEPRKKPMIDPATAKKTKPREPSQWEPVIPAPADAGEMPLAHPVRGLRQEFWTYKMPDGVGIIGGVYRYPKSGGGKETLPCVYCRHKKTGKGEWRWLSFTQPRPLYGLDRLAAKPDAYVLLVSGEKCADAAVDMLEGVCVTWPGGDNAVSKTDFSPLAGRKIFAWADCDAQRELLTEEEKEAGIDPETKPFKPEHEQSGMKAMLQIRDILLELDPTTDFHFVNIPAPGEKPSGWDIADAVQEGMNAAKLTSLITNTRPQPHLAAENTKPKKSKSTPKTAGAGQGEPADIEQPDDRPKWVRCLLRKGNDLVACLANVVDILENDDRWQDVVAYNEFAQRVVKLKPPPYWDDKGKVGEWNDDDDARTAIWITKNWRFSPSPGMVADAIAVFARNNIINPPRDWLQGLQWDGEKRVDKWLLDYLGVPLTPYSTRVARWFLMGMVKRVLEPGCKFDYCMVLEGDQGKKKSSAFEALGGEWYGDTDLDLHSKDAMDALAGKMLYEISELDSLAKAESSKQKSFLSRRVDEYRQSYGRRPIKAPRTCVFGGSVNGWEWNKDPTGGRRFWPIRVEVEVDVDGIRTMRDQLFAEAVVMVNSKIRYWPTAIEQKQFFDSEQLKRQIQDSIIDALYDKVMTYKQDFTINYAGTDWLNLQQKDLTHSMVTRIGYALRALGCTKVEKKTNTITRYWYRPPAQQDDLSENNNLGGNDGNDLSFV